MQKRFHFALLILGFSGMVAQIILLRELLIIYLGNELSIGIILSNWLISEAAGALFMGFLAGRSSHKISLFVILQAGFSLIFPLSIIGIRIFKTLFSLTSGEMLSPGIIFFSSLFLVFLPSCIHGSLFTLSCKLKEKKDEPAVSIGHVYILETLGNILAALCLTFFLIPRFHSLDIAFIVSLLILFSCLFIVYPKRLKSKIAFLIVIACFLSAFYGVSDNLHNTSIHRQWKGQKILAYRNSIFGNITATRMNEQVTFYSNANPVFLCPTPDIEGLEELVHIPLLFHSAPENILVVSGGLGGLLNELLKYPNIHIDYTEIDPAIIQTAAAIDNRFSLEPIHSELQDERIRHYPLDGRLFVMNTDHMYDAIFVNLHLPSDLQTNRLYTKEFFQASDSRLKKNGLLILTLPGSLNYLTEEIKNLHACILLPLKSVFPSLLIIPGETNIIIASHNVLPTNIDALTKKLIQRDIPTHILTPFHLSLKLDSQYRQWFQKEMKDVVSKPNEDLNPIGVFHAQSYQNSFFSPEKKNMFTKISHLPLFAIIVLFLIPPCLILPFRALSSKCYARTSLSWTILTTGLCSMFFNMTSLLVFQILYGYVYYWLSLLIAFFMAGISMGGYWGTQYLKKSKPLKRIIIFLQFSMIGLLLLLPLSVFALKGREFFSVFHSSFRYILLIFNFFFGLLQGFEFPLVSKNYNFYTGKIEKTAGFLYASDLLGGFVGGIVSTVILIPLYGFIQSCLAIVLLKITGLLLLMWIKKQE